MGKKCKKHSEKREGAYDERARRTRTRAAPQG